MGWAGLVWCGNRRTANIDLKREGRLFFQVHMQKVPRMLHHYVWYMHKRDVSKTLELHVYVSDLWRLNAHTAQLLGNKFSLRVH